MNHTRQIVFDKEPVATYGPEPVANVEYNVSDTSIQSFYPAAPSAPLFPEYVPPPSFNPQYQQQSGNIHYQQPMLDFDTPPPPYSPPESNMFPSSHDIMHILPTENRLYPLNPSYHVPEYQRHTFVAQPIPKFNQHPPRPSTAQQHRNEIEQVQPNTMVSRASTSMQNTSQRHSAIVPPPSNYRQPSIVTLPEPVLEVSSQSRRQSVPSHHQQQQQQQHRNNSNARHPAVRRFIIRGNGQGSSIRLQIEENRHLVYICIFHFDDHIAVLDANNKKVAVITKGLFNIHPTFHVAMNGRQIGKCTKRFKLSLSQKKINYKKLDTGEVIKLVGTFNSTMHFTKNEKKIGTLTLPKKGKYILEVDSHPTDIFHVLMLFLIMIEIKYTE